jgi:hypothetical protein
MQSILRDAGKGLEKEKKKSNHATSPTRCTRSLDRAVTFLRFGVRMALLSHALLSTRDASPLFSESRLSLTYRRVCYRSVVLIRRPPLQVNDV